MLGAGSVGLAAVCVALTARAFLADGEVREFTLWTWMAVGEFTPHRVYIDGLTVVMMSVITGVGFIHLYSVEFMWEDESICRYFAHMNLFVGAMLLLVMADNLLLLYLGWEGVGVCSYLLVGFWYRTRQRQRRAQGASWLPASATPPWPWPVPAVHRTRHPRYPTAAGRRRQPVAGRRHPAHSRHPPAAGGAVGKSAQLPLHTWLPDAMAGPTPVSALIRGHHGDRRRLPDRPHLRPVPAGAAHHGSRRLDRPVHPAAGRLSPPWPNTISSASWPFIRPSARSVTCSWRPLASAPLPRHFPPVTHAFFKALLFSPLARSSTACTTSTIFSAWVACAPPAGGVLGFLIGSAALAASFTSGFTARTPSCSPPGTAGIGHWLWAGGLLGALLTGNLQLSSGFRRFSKPIPNPITSRAGKCPCRWPCSACCPWWEACWVLPWAMYSQRPVTTQPAIP